MNYPGARSYWFSIKLNESYQLDYLVSPASSSLVYFGPFLMSSFLIPFSLHTVLHVRAFQGSGPVILTLCLISSTHGFTNSLFSGNFQIHFFSLHFSPKLQIHEASGEVPQTHQIQTEFIFLQTQSGNLEVLDIYQVLQCLLLVDTFSQATIRVCKEYNFTLKYILHSSRNIVFVNINSANQSFPSTTSSLRLQLSFTSYQLLGGAWRVWVLALYPLLLMLHLLTWLGSLWPWSLACFCTSIHWDVRLVIGAGSTQVTLYPNSLAPLPVASVPPREGEAGELLSCFPTPPWTPRKLPGKTWKLRQGCHFDPPSSLGTHLFVPQTLISGSVGRRGSAWGSFLVILAALSLSCFPSIPLPWHKEGGSFKKNLIWGEKFKSRELTLSLLQQRPSPESQGRGYLCCCLNCWERRGGKGAINARKEGETKNSKISPQHISLEHLSYLVQLFLHHFFFLSLTWIATIGKKKIIKPPWTLNLVLQNLSLTHSFLQLYWDIIDM